MKKPKPSSDYVGTAEVSRITGLHITSVRHKLRGGKIAGAFMLGRDWAVPKGRLTDGSFTVVSKTGWVPGRKREGLRGKAAIGETPEGFKAGTCGKCGRRFIAPTGGEVGEVSAALLGAVSLDWRSRVYQLLAMLKAGNTLWLCSQCLAVIPVELCPGSKEWRLKSADNSG